MGKGNRAGAARDQSRMVWYKENKGKKERNQETVMGKGWGTGDRTLKRVCAVCGKDPQMKDSSQCEVPGGQF